MPFGTLVNQEIRIESTFIGKDFERFSLFWGISEGVMILYYGGIFFIRYCIFKIFPKLTWPAPDDVKHWSSCYSPQGGVFAPCL